MELTNIKGSWYEPNFVENDMDLFKKCLNEIQNNKNNFQIAGGSGGGPIVSAFHLQEFPSFLEPILKKIEESGYFNNTKPFQISFNYYPCSDFSLSPHKDAKGSQAIIISLGSSFGLDFYYHPSNRYTIVFGQDEYDIDPIGTAILESGSLFLFSNESFSQYLHGIQRKEYDIINENTLNLDKIKLKLKDSSKRSERISIVIWSE